MFFVLIWHNKECHMTIFGHFLKVRHRINLNKLILFVMLVVLLIGIFIGSSLLVNGHSEIAKSPLVYNLSNFLRTYKIHFGDLTCDKSSVCVSHPAFKDEQWENYIEGKTLFRKLPGYSTEGGTVTYRLKFIVPKDLYFSTNAIAISLIHVDLASYKIYVNGNLTADVDGQLPLNSNGLIGIPRDFINSDRFVTVVLLGKYQRDNRGVDHNQLNLLGPRNILEKTYVSMERKQNTYYMMFISLKLGILAIFILLFLFSEPQLFLKYFVCYGIGVTFDAFFFIDLVPQFMRLPQSQFYGVFNLQLLGFFALWYFVEAVLEVNIKVQKYIFFLFLVIINTLIFLLFRSSGKIITKNILDTHAIMIGYILLSICLIIFLRYLKVRTAKIAETPISHLLVIFGTYFISYIFSYVLLSQTLNYRQPIDVVFFLCVSYMTVREFAANQIKIRDQIRLLQNQQSDVEIGQSTSRIVHDLRKPFQNFKIVLEAFKGQFIANHGGVEAALVKLLPSVDYAEELIEDVLRKKRKSILKVTMLNVQVLVNILNETLLDELREKNINLNIDNSTNGNLQIDKNKFISIFQNILINAEEALTDTEKKKVWISFAEFTNSIGQKKCRIIIGNNGPGIPESIIDKLFKTDISYGKENGTGIGLRSICTIILAHQGEIQVRNLNLNRGVEFEIILDLYPLVLASPSDVAVNSPGNSALLPKISKPQINKVDKIVIVDDDQLMQMAWRLAWPTEDILQYSNPSELLSAIESKIIKSSDFDLVFTELYFNHPIEMTGTDLARQLQNFGIKSVVLLSGVALDKINQSDKSVFIDVVEKEILSPKQVHERYI